MLRYLIDAALLNSALLTEGFVEANKNSTELGFRVFAYAVASNIIMYCCAYVSTLLVTTLHFHYAFTCVRMHHNEAYCLWKESVSMHQLCMFSLPSNFNNCNDCFGVYRTRIAGDFAA